MAVKPKPAVKVEVAPGRRDWLMVTVAAVGFVIAAYLTRNQLAGARALFCEAGSGCEIVQASRYAVLLGLPTPAWGMGLYLAVAILGAVGLSLRRWLAAFVLAVAGASFSAYLTYIELFVLRALCPYCLLSAAVSVVLLGAVLRARPAPAGRRSPVRRNRLIGVGVATALVTVVAGAAIYAIDEPTAALPYQQALARHLAATGAVMYGAYW